MSKQEEAINHKEFITWREFMNYFEDYQPIDARNKKSKAIESVKAQVKSKAAGETINLDDEMKGLLEQEKERRLLELPKLRQADQIDITEEQLQAIRDVFEKQKTAEVCSSVAFFMGIRKSAVMKAQSSAIARDPEGCSRIPRETFQQVFDRMEGDNPGKTIEWPFIVEYFTKRGRPLTKEEIKQLQDEDRKMKEEA